MWCNHGTHRGNRRQRRDRQRCEVHSRHAMHWHTHRSGRCGGPWRVALLIALIGGVMWYMHQHRVRRDAGVEPRRTLVERIREDRQRSARGGTERLVIDNGARLELRLDPDRLAERAASFDTAAVAIRALVERLNMHDHVEGEGPPNVAELENITIDGETGERLRLGDVARLIRQRSGPRREARDAVIVIRFAIPADDAERQRLAMALRQRLVMALEALNLPSGGLTELGWSIEEDGDFIALVRQFDGPWPGLFNGIPLDGSPPDNHAANLQDEAAAQTADRSTSEDNPSNPLAEFFGAAIATAIEQARAAVNEAAEAGRSAIESAEQEVDKKLAEPARPAPPRPTAAPEVPVRPQENNVAEKPQDEAPAVKVAARRQAVQSQHAEEPQRSDEQDASQALDSSADLAATDPATYREQPKPSWIGRPPQLDGGVWRVSGSTGPVLREDCHHALTELLQKMTREYAAEYLGPAAARIDVPLSFIQQHVVQDTWIGPWRHAEPGIDLGNGGHVSDELYECHVLLAFNERARNELAEQWRDQQIQARLGYVGLSAASVLALLATFFGYLKIDTATRGYYSGRLKLAAGVVIMAIGVVIMAILALVTSALGELRF